MATQKPISTISYNSVAFLKEKLDTWVQQHIIQTYMYIRHKGEDGDKDHTHVRLEPNKKLDPMELTDMLREFDKGSNKPLGVRPWRPSKEEDWFLYVVHDKDYLNLKYGGAEKGEKLPYDFHDIVVPENYDLDTAFIRAKAYLKHSSTNIATRIQKGESSTDLILQGENPYVVNAIMRAFSVNDYQRLANEYQTLDSEHNKLLQAIEEAHLTITVLDDGKFKIE